MLPKLTRYVRPSTPAEALEVLREPGSAPLAGGTQLLATVNAEVEQVVDLQALDWRRIDTLPGWLRLGSLVTLAELAQAEHLTGPAGELLRRAAYRAGPNTFRNAATLGGLIGARPASSELLAVLLVLAAELELAGDSLETLSLEAFLGAPRGLIAAVRLPWPSAGAGAAHAIGRTPADAPIVHVAAWAGPGGTRLAAGGVGPRVMRLPGAERALALGLEAAAAATAVLEPRGDFRGSAEYRRAMLGVLVRRALQDCGAKD